MKNVIEKCNPLFIASLLKFYLQLSNLRSNDRNILVEMHSFEL